MKTVAAFLLCWLYWLPACGQQDTLCRVSAEQCLREGEALMENKQYAEARNCMKRGCSLADPKSEIWSECLNGLATAYYMEGMGLDRAGIYQQGYVYLDKALGYFRELGAKDNMIQAYKRLAEINRFGLVRYGLAREQYQAAYRLSVELEDFEQQVRVQADLLGVLEQLGLWEERNRGLARIDSIVEVSGDSLLKLQSELIVGDAAVNGGRFEEAAVFYQRALDYALEDTARTDVFLVYSRFRNLAMVQEDYDKAYEYSQHCVREYCRTFRDQPVKRCFAYVMHAEICARARKREECFRSADSLFAGQRYGMNNQDKAQHYLYRGMWHASFEEYEAAVADYEEAHRLLAALPPEEVVGDRKDLLALHAIALSRLERYREAEALYEDYLEICRKVDGPRSLGYAAALEYLANVEGYTGNWEEGARHYAASARLKMDRARTDLRLLPATAREGHWKRISRTLWNMTQFAVGCGFRQNEFTGQAYDALLFAKGLLLASEKSMASEVEALQDSSVTEDYGRMMALYQQMSVAEAGGKEQEAAACFARMNELDRKLVLHLGQRGRGIPLNDVEGGRLLRSLKKGEAVVDFMDYVSQDGKHTYVAYLLAEGWAYPKLVPLATQQQLDSLLLQAGGRWERLYEAPVSEAFRRLVWDPVEAELEKTKTVYYVPSGALHQVALESLSADRGKLLGNRYHFIRLTSAREVLSYPEHRRMKGLERAVLYGGLDYDAFAEAPSPACETAVGGSEEAARMQPFKPIVHSADEVKAIGQILSREHLQVHTYLGRRGTKASFVAMDGQSPDILQLATHGFCQPSGTAAPAGLSGYRDMMFLTGLAMAGGNAEWTGKVGPEGFRDGLLRSADIALLDLDQVQLVVLSACVSGKGKVTPEGLYGLQRAFKKAGVQTQLLTLWPVSDVATRDFMTAFYQCLVKRRWDKRKAFYEAKEKIRRKYGDPVYWAGFIMVD